jgi:hypothetical protein
MAINDPAKKAKETAIIVEDALKSIANQVQDIFEQALSGAGNVSESVAKDIELRFKKIAKVSDEIASNSTRLQEGLLKTKEVEDQIIKRKTQQNALETQLLIHLRQQGKEASSIKDLIEQQRKGTVSLDSAQQSLVDEYQKAVSYNEEYIDQLKEQKIEVEKINKQVGLTGKLLKGINKIPIIGEFLDAEEALKAANKAAAGGATKLQTMGVAAKSLGKSLITNVTDPLTIATSLLKGMMQADKLTGELAKNLGITFNEAGKTRQEFARVANLSMDSNVTVKGLQESLSAVNNELGTSANLSTEELTTMTKLNKQAGISLETQAKLSTIAKATGVEYKDFVSSFQGAAKAAKFQAGASINTKKLMTDVANVSNRTKLSLQGGADGLAKAAVSAKLMGSDLDKVAGIADQLLDFESSIENELSAELLLGKDINLEKARQAALNNDLATVAEEITKQAGSAEKFSEMNRIQQEAMAKAVGMTADGLADTLVEQEALKAVGHDLSDQEKEAFEAAKSKYGLEKASQMLKDDQINQLLEEQTNQEKFAAITEKLQEVFVQIGDALMPIFTMLGDIATTIIPAINFLVAPLIEGFSLVGQAVSGFIEHLKEGKGYAIALAGVLGLLAAPLIASAIGAIFSTFAMIPLGIGIPLAGIAIAGMISLLAKSTSSAKSMKDGVIDSKGGMVVSGEKGSIQLDKQDSIVAGTNLFGGSKKSSGGGDVSVLVNAINELRRDVNALANRPVNVAIDGKKVIEATTGAQPNTVGDETGKNSYQVA